MKSHIAEYVSPGHPDRLADAIVESIVDLAVGRDNEALVGVECAVHTDHVFIDGRIAAGRARPPDAPPAATAAALPMNSRLVMSSSFDYRTTITIPRLQTCTLFMVVWKL